MEKHHRDYSQIKHKWGIEQLESIIHCIEFVLVNGTRHGFNYHSLSWIIFEPDNNRNSIEIGFEEHVVKITGFMLEPVYQKILQKELLSVHEQGERYKELYSADESVITAITVERKEDGI